MGMFMRRGAPPKVSVELDSGIGAGFSDKYAYVTINGVKYSSRKTLEVYRGTVVDVYVSAQNDRPKTKCYVKDRGRVVKKGAGTYQYTVLSPSKLTFRRMEPNSSEEYRYCNITRT